MRIKDFKNFPDILLVGEPKKRYGGIGYDPYWEQIFWEILPYVEINELSLSRHFDEIFTIFGEWELDF